jgi:hypothetical protein
MKFFNGIAQRKEDCFMDELNKEQARLESRSIIEQLKAEIKRHISRFDYDSLQEIETMLRLEKHTRPEELYF